MQEQIFEMASQTHILRLQTKYCNRWHMNHNSFPKIMFDMEAFSLLDCTCRSLDAKTFFPKFELELQLVCECGSDTSVHSQ